MNKEDIDALEKILIKAGGGTPDEFSKVRSSSELGLLVRADGRLGPRSRPKGRLTVSLPGRHLPRIRFTSSI